MKASAVLLCVAIIVTTCIVISFASQDQPAPEHTTVFTKDNIGDILQMMGPSAALLDQDALIAELNERSRAAEIAASQNLLSDPLHDVELGQLRKSAYYSAIARCLNWGPKSVVDWSCDYCKKTPKLIDVSTGAGKPSDLAWFIGYSHDDNEIVVTARSSTTIENWLYDLDFKGVDFAECPGCSVHNGFLKAYQEIRHDYLNAITALHKKYPTAKVRVQGHSLAASVSQHVVLDLATGFFTQVEVKGQLHWHNRKLSHYNTMTHDQFNAIMATPGAVVHVNDIHFELTLPFYNFGSPRVGNAAWSTYFNSKIGPTALIRSTHLNDPVPRVPPQNLIWKYQHASNEIYWYSDSKYRGCKDGAGGEDKSCAVGNLLPINILDHIWYNGILLACVPN